MRKKRQTGFFLVLPTETMDGAMHVVVLFLVRKTKLLFTEKKAKTSKKPDSWMVFTLSNFEQLTLNVNLLTNRLLSSLFRGMTVVQEEPSILFKIASPSYYHIGRILPKSASRSGTRKSHRRLENSTAVSYKFPCPTSSETLYNSHSKKCRKCWQ